MHEYLQAAYHQAWIVEGGVPRLSVILECAQESLPDDEEEITESFLHFFLDEQRLAYVLDGSIWNSSQKSIGGDGFG